ncbi:MAG: acyl-CoA dehydrogenase [Gammaproteobacteria bacterium]|nr:acyl-CoA dehydrogenase [Gammaproteobacteria bacterium]
MSDYRAPVADMLFAVTELAGLAGVRRLPGFEEATDDVVAHILEEAGRFAGEVLAPLNRDGDRHGTRVEDRRVVPAPGFKDAYRRFVEGGWNGLPGPVAFSGQGLPQVVAMPVAEMWTAANMAFSLCPMLTQGAVDALIVHGCEALKNRYLDKLVTGEWTGTMNLTEPQAGSDLAAVATRAVPKGDHYLITGQKIFITYGDHDFTDNIIHMVLARVPGGPPGTKGLSLFLVPKVLVGDDGALGRPNDLFPVSVEHKLGINASPTCVMSYGENGGAVGYLVGELHNGMACMFTMMNEARVAVGLEGVGLGERAYQQARDYAKDRVQGTTPDGAERVAIIRHADVRRMLMFMRSATEAMRALAYVTAAAVDHAHRVEEPAQRAQHEARVALLTPIVKGWSTELAQEVVSIGVQVHGGMGFIEETGAAQHFRDARIAPIYEGTTGIQALDLVGRKILRDGGRSFGELMVEIGHVLAALDEFHDPAARAIAFGLSESLRAVEEAATWLQESWRNDVHAAGAAAYNFLMLMGTVCGGWQMAKAALVAQRKLAAGEGDTAYCRAKIVTARFYAEHILPRAGAYGRAVTAGSDSTMALEAEAF